MKRRCRNSSIVGGRRAALWFLAATVCAVAATAQDDITVKGKVTGRDRIGEPNIAQARVQILYSSRAKKIFIGTTADGGGVYKIENVSAGSVEIVACDDLLDREPKSRTETVQRGSAEINFKLEPKSESSGIQLEAGDRKFIYLKHLKTGCESGPIKSEKDQSGKLFFNIKNTDPDGFEQEYAYCETKEAVNDPAPFETCLNRSIRNGMTPQQALDSLRQQQSPIVLRHGEKEIYVYRFARITFMNGKVTGMSVGVEPSP